MPIPETQLIEEARKVLRTEAEAVAALSAKVDASFARAVEMVRGCGGRVIVTGMGKSGLIAQKIAATLASTGTPAFFLHPGEAGHGDLGMVTRDDILLALSNSGETEEVMTLLPYVKRFGVRLISMTGNPSSALARSSDAHLDVGVRDEACPMGIVPTASTTAALAMGDALAVVLLIARGFQKEDFACYHPKGALGKKLLTRVRDLMHSGDAIPFIAPDTPMDKTVLEISVHRLGLAVVRGSGGAMLGVITDGDIRRGIEHMGKALFDKLASDVMTVAPKTIGPDVLAAEALAIMEKHSITALVVKDDGGHAAGVIHIHDILKAGIV